MKKVLAFLSQNPVGALGTIDEDRPRVRPWSYIVDHDDRPYFCTGHAKKVYRQLMTNALVEFTSTSEDGVTLRLWGKAVFTADNRIKARVYQAAPEIHHLYHSADDPLFEVFCIEPEGATYADFAGKILDRAHI